MYLMNLYPESLRRTSGGRALGMYISIYTYPSVYISIIWIYIWRVFVAHPAGGP